MSAWVIIPAKAPPAAKGRLAKVLADDERSHLAQAMLRAAVHAACAAVGSEHVLLVGDSRLGADAGIRLLGEPDGGLNAALIHGRDEAVRNGASRVISLAADLPLVTPDDVRALVAVPKGAAAIAPDRHGTGTNAISLPIPAGAGFAYAYGIGSFARHLNEAESMGLAMHRIDRPGLARDVDEPADLQDASALLLSQHR